MLVQSTVAYVAGATGTIQFASVGDYTAGDYPFFDKTVNNIKLGDFDSRGYIGGSLKPNPGESYADFQIRLNAYLTTQYNALFGAGNWVGGLCSSIYDDTTNVLADFDPLYTANGVPGVSPFSPLQRVGQSYQKYEFEFKQSALNPNSRLKYELNWFTAAGVVNYKESESSTVVPTVSGQVR